MKKAAAIILTLISIGLYAASPSLQKIIDSANALYARKQYDSALVLYKSVLEKGWQAPELYYNIGNVYFRKGNLPKAILFYERAYRLDPANDKIKHNLLFARQFVQDKFETVPEFFLRRWWRGVALWCSANTWAVISIVLFLIALALGYIFLFARRIPARKLGFYLGIVFLLLSVLTFSLSISNKRYFLDSHQAVIMHTTSLRSAPSMESTELYILHEGVEVKVLSFNDGWVEVKLPNGTIGWLKKTDIEKI